MDARHPVVLVTELLVGVALLLGGLLLARRERGAGVLLAAAGATWLLGFLWPVALFWHRGPVVHLLLAFPGLRPLTLPALAVTAAAYGLSVVAPAVWLDDRATVALAVALVAAAGWNLRGTSGIGKHRRRQALRLTLLVGGALGFGGGVRWVTDGAAWLLALVAYDVALVALVALLHAASTPTRVTRLRDLVIDLADTPEQPSRDALARTLRDPDLVVAVWDPERSGYVTSDGERLELPAQGRAATRVDRDGQPFVLLLHDQSLQGDPRLREALDVATRMDSVNATWQAEVARQAQRVEESRRRLLAASDDERRRLAAELARGVEARLDRLAESLRVVGGGPVGPHLERAVSHLARTRSELAELAAGLRPRTLEQGLDVAVRELVGASPGHVTVEADLPSLPGDVELTAYYVCAEALANATKHAPGAPVTVAVRTRGDVLRVVVTDEGPGGAQLTGRGGLLGLRDRVESLGGRFEVISDDGGTRVTTELPLGRHPR